MAPEGVTRSKLDLHLATLLRGMVPYRGLSREEALFYAEQQASVLLKLVQVHEPPVPVEELALETGLVRHVINDSMQIALGKSTLKVNGDWIVTLNTARAEDQRSFVTAHEVKHILDYQFVDVLYPPVAVSPTARRREDMANYFALCLTMPRSWLKMYAPRCPGDPGGLAQVFDTSRELMEFRLATLGLLSDRGGQYGMVEVGD